ncbi:DUF3370 domain-containing protein [Prochlorococcus sp. MIT 1303]|uniref:DUF3370 domain-containing protein n=1 Tax=Prochlorococcus sp. MIT 1303 TaxID=1723647 RepID=UPI0007B37A06|nr:DUF3370 domain-containing protein [Prochlorococcus sp. MIT 1303]KZR64325.1 hypothetical protein PMIT1303_01367 [Prochlorococcus sp. MIT 1303]
MRSLLNVTNPSGSKVSPKISLLVSLSLSTLACEIAFAKPSWSYVPLMAGQSARPLNGSFNKVPVLHSNQPETVVGSGILVNTAPGSAVVVRTGQQLRNAEFTFDGKFGIHIHHKYYPRDRRKLGNIRQRGLLTIAAIANNPTDSSIELKFDRGSVKNSFEAPYHSNKLMGVKPLGPRPWNTGPGDATAVQMLRGKLDRKLVDNIVIPPHTQKLVFTTQIPARGIANGLLSGTSNGPFQLAVVAAEGPTSEKDLIAILNSGRLAPGRTYLNRISEIQTGKVFSRVAGVAIGDHYTAKLNHDLKDGALHVPLTSTRKHHFGTKEIQVNPLETRMIDSAVNNVGTYGVRFDITLNLKGSGAHHLVLSHPAATGKKKPFTAFRGSIGIKTENKYKEVHVGLRSGQSLPISDLELTTKKDNPVTISLVYPADNTPGHLLSVVPVAEYTQVMQKQEKVNQAKLPVTARKNYQAKPLTPKPIVKAKIVEITKNSLKQRHHDTYKSITNKKQLLANESYDHNSPVSMPPILISSPSRNNAMPSAMINSQRVNSSLSKHYTEAIKAQQQWLHQMQN